MADENNANSGHISVLDRKKYGDVVDNVLGNTDVIIKYPSFTVEDGIHVKPSQVSYQQTVELLHEHLVGHEGTSNTTVMSHHWVSSSHDHLV